MRISRDQAARFVEAYGQTWENWDLDGFVDLFTEDVIYVEHPTDETIVGREQMQAYIRNEHEYQGVAAVQMGIPLVDGCQVAAEFWATMTNADALKRSLIGCFIARLDPTDGRCAHFRRYWFVTKDTPRRSRGGGAPDRQSRRASRV
jgi:ketosteroid isomerase-like protein